jgi:flagellar hook protein FlgE
MDISSVALQGLNQADAQLNQAAAGIAALASSSSDGGNLDTVTLSVDMVALMSAKSDFAANVKVTQTADHIQQNSISLQA